MPPELTRLKMSTTTSTVLSAPVMLSTWTSRSKHVANAMEAVDKSKKPGVALDPDATAEGPPMNSCGDVDPERVVLHLDWAVELERLVSTLNRRFC